MQCNMHRFVSFSILLISFAFFVDGNNDTAVLDDGEEVDGGNVTELGDDNKQDPIPVHSKNNADSSHHGTEVAFRAGVSNVTDIIEGSEEVFNNIGSNSGNATVAIDLDGKEGVINVDRYNATDIISTHVYIANDTNAVKVDDDGSDEADAIEIDIEGKEHGNIVDRNNDTDIIDNEEVVLDMNSANATDSTEGKEVKMPAPPMVSSCKDNVNVKAPAHVCPPTSSASAASSVPADNNSTPLVWIVGGCVAGVLVILAVIVTSVWCWRRGSCSSGDRGSDDRE